MLKVCKIGWSRHRIFKKYLCRHLANKLNILDDEKTHYFPTRLSVFGSKNSCQIPQPRLCCKTGNMVYGGKIKYSKNQPWLSHFHDFNVTVQHSISSVHEPASWHFRPVGERNHLLPPKQPENAASTTTRRRQLGWGRRSGAARRPQKAFHFRYTVTP